MAVTDAQKVDYLWKKVGFGVAKTDTSSVKSASNEANASPLLIRGDTLWVDSGSIPNIAPAANTTIVQTYLGTAAIQMVNDATSSTNRTWVTNLPDWISTEFGSTYQPKLWAAPSGTANAAATGTRLFPDGSGNNDAWFFDPQAGLVNFDDTNVPTAVSGNVVFIEGYRYIGAKGVGNIASNNFLDNITITTTTISTDITNGNIYLSPTGTGIVQITGTRAFSIPAGTTAQEPSGVPTGSLRFNTDVASPEFFNGNSWVSLSTAVGYQTFSGNGTGNTFPLNQSTTTGGVLVSLNGVQQTPNVAYTVSGSSITFTETPETSDVIDVRYIASGQELSLTLPPDFTQAVTISNTLSVSGNTTVSALTVNNSATIGTTLGVTGNAIVGNLNSSGNINGSYIFGNGSQLTAVTAVTAQYVTQATQSNITAVGTLTNLVVNNSITVSNAVSYSPTVTYINASATVIDSFANTSARSVKYVVQTSDSANVKYQVDEILLCQDGNISTIAVYGTVSTNGNIVGFSSNVVGTTVQLYAQSTGGNCAVKATKLTIAV